MKGLSISGGSTKIAALAGAGITVCTKHNYAPDVISGVSAGSILALPFALGLFDEIKDQVLNFSLDDIFSISPVNTKGSLSFKAKVRAVTGKESLGAQRALVDTMKKIITKEQFDKYKAGNYARCFLGAVEFKTGKRKYFDVKESSYDNYFEFVLASASIPVFVESVKLEDGYWYDGGVRDHIGSHWLMENFDLKEHVSIYSRPEDYNITDLTWKPDSIVKVLERALDIMGVEISKNDEFKEDILAFQKGIKNIKILMPSLLGGSAYETNPIVINEWYKIGVEAAGKAML